MKRYIALLLAFAIFSGSLLFAAKITDETLLLGGSASSDQFINFKNGRKLKANQSTSKMQFSHDGTNFFDFGDVVGPATPTDEAIVRFDGTTGKLIQNSVVTATDAGIVSGVTQLNTDNLRLDGNTVSSTDTNGAVNITPNGTGQINLHSVVVSSASAVSGATQLDVDNIRINGNTISSTDTNGNILLSADGTGVVRAGDINFDENLIQPSTTNAHVLIKGNGTGTVKLGDAELIFPDADGSSGHVLTTNGSGTLSFQAASGSAGPTVSYIGKVGCGAGGIEENPGTWITGYVNDTTGSCTITYSSSIFGNASNPVCVAIPVTGGSPLFVRTTVRNDTTHNFILQNAAGTLINDSIAFTCTGNAP